MTRSILVLGCDDRSGLTVIRSLGRAAIAVDIAWPQCRSVVKSRYVRDVIDLPDPRGGSDDWLPALKHLMNSRQYDLVLPCTDDALIPIQRYKNEICKLGRVYCLDDQAFLGTFNKFNTTLLAQRLGIRLPHWQLIRSPQEIGTADRSFGFPLVVKPISSFHLEKPAERREVQVVRNENEFATIVEQLLHDGPVQIQAFFRGTGVGVELLANEGRVLAAFQHQRVHEPPGGGGSSYRKSVPLNPELLEAATAIVTALRYTGVMMVEFRVNLETGDWVLVETNGRFWGSLPLCAVSGMDFPLHLYRMLVDGRSDPSGTYRTGVYCRNLRLDLRWFRKNLTADPDDSTILTLPLGAIIKELRNILTLSEHIDTFALDDPRPFMVEMGELGRLAIRSFVKRARLPGFSKIRKKWRARAALTKIQNATTVTFVCFGNICRSPFAEAYARSIAPPNVVLASAGTFEKEDRHSPYHAQAAAIRMGIDLSTHRSTFLRSELVDKSDVIVVFDHQNWNDVARRFPNAKSKMVRLGDLLPGYQDDIPDPFDQSMERFENCYRLIMDSLSQFWIHERCRNS